MDRRDDVLRMIVETFIETASPVGSKSLIEKYNLNISSATIRNVMQELENEGYIEKPHTSGGRIPSTNGYQYYIDNLRKSNIDSDVKYKLQTMLDNRLKSVQEILSKSCEVLSQMTNMASIILGNSDMEESLASLQLVPISNNSSTVIFVTSKGKVVNKTFFFDESLRLSDLQKCVDILSKRLVGTKICEIKDKLDVIKPIIQDYLIDGDLMYQSLLSTLSSLTNSKVIIYGREKLLEQPEFNNDPNDIKTLIKLLESPDFFKDITDETLKSNGISVKIGNDQSQYKNISILSAKVDLPGARDNIISLIGPVRMDYSNAISILKGLINEIDIKYNKKEGGSDEWRNKRKRWNKRWWRYFDL